MKPHTTHAHSNCFTMNSIYISFTSIIKYSRWTIYSLPMYNTCQGIHSALSYSKGLLETDGAFSRRTTDIQIIYEFSYEENYMGLYFPYPRFSLEYIFPTQRILFDSVTKKIFTLPSTCTGRRFDTFRIDLSWKECSPIDTSSRFVVTLTNYFSPSFEYFDSTYSPIPDARRHLYENLIVENNLRSMLPFIFYISINFCTG